MSQPQRRHDSYGRPLPSLAPPRQQALHEEPTNQALWQQFLRLLYEEWDALLVRGTHAELTATVHVQDGRLQRDMQIQVTRQVRCE